MIFHAIRNRIHAHASAISGAALVLIGAVVLVWALPLITGSGWIVRQLQSQFPAATMHQLGWRTLPSPSIAVQRIDIPGRSLVLQGDMRLKLALGPLLAGRVEPKALEFSRVAVSQKTFVSPALSGRLTWSKATQTLDLSMACPQDEWATAQVSKQALDVTLGGPTLCGLAPASPHPLGTVTLHGTPQFAPDQVGLDGIALTLGTARFDGSAQLAYNDIPRFDLALSTPRIDLDSGQTATQIGRSDPDARHPNEAAPNGDWSPITPAHAATAAAAALPAWSFRLPQGIFATVSLAAAEVAHHHLAFRSVAAQVTLDDGELVVNRLDGIPPGGGKVALDATLATPGGAPIVDGHARIAADHPEILLAWLGLGAGTALPPALAELEGTATDGMISLRKLMLKSGDMGIDGAADLTLGPNALAIDQARLTLIGTPWDRAQILAQGALVSDEHGLTRLDGLKLVSGQTSITGSVGVAPVLGRPAIAADLGGDHWLLDRLGALQSSSASAQPSSDKGKGKAAAPSAAGSLAPPKVQRSPLAPEPPKAAPSGLHAPDIRLTLHPQSASFAGTLIEQPKAEIAIAGDSVSIDHFSARLWGGDVVGSGRMTMRGLPQVSATLSAGGVDIGQAQLSAGPLRLTKGSASGDARCASIGRNSADMIRHLECTGQIRVNAGEIAGIDLAAIDRAAKQISQPIGILGLAQAGTHGGRTTFTALTATLKAADGTLSTDDARLDADGGTVLLKGSYATIPQTVDARAELRLAGTTTLPAVGLRLTGPVAQPRVALDMNDLLRAGAINALGKSSSLPASAPQLLKGLIKSLSQP